MLGSLDPSFFCPASAKHGPMRVLVLDLGDVPTDLRLSLLRMLPQCGRQFTNVVVPHRDAHTVRSSAYPALLQILQSCNYHVRWHGAYGLKPKLRGIRDCRRALMEHGIDEFDDHDDSFDRCFSAKTTFFFIRFFFFPEKKVVFSPGGDFR